MLRRLAQAKALFQSPVVLRPKLLVTSLTRSSEVCMLQVCILFGIGHILRMGA